MMTTFTMDDGTVYESNAKGNYFYKSTGKVDAKGQPIMRRCSRAVFEQAFDEHVNEVQFEDDRFEQEMQEAKAEAKAEAEKSDREAEKEVNKKSTRKSTPRKSKDVAFKYETGEVTITLTAKQVDFMNEMVKTNFWENGLDSSLWTDILADEIGGQFTDKPMTTGAMISTLCEKGIAYRVKNRINKRTVTAMGLTELGKAVAKGLGLE